MTTDAETGKPQTDTQDLTPKGPEDEGSLAAALENVPKVIFTGHPAEADGGVLGIGPEGNGEPEETRTGEEDGGGKAKAEPEFKPKYKSHEEAERAHQEAERKMHEATTQAAKDREAREAAERELNELRQKAEKPPETPATEKPPSREEAKTRVKQALKAIRELDEEDPAYDEKVAEAWADAGIGSVNQDEITNIVAKQIKAEREADRAATAAADAKTAEAKIRSDAEKFAVKAGLKMDKGTADARLFWDVAREIPDDIAKKPLKEQVDWVVSEVRTLTGQVVQTKEEAREAARRHQIVNAPLDRGGNRVKVPPKTETITMGSLIDKSMASRRI